MIFSVLMWMTCGALEFENFEPVSVSLFHIVFGKTSLVMTKCLGRVMSNMTAWLARTCLKGLWQRKPRAGILQSVVLVHFRAGVVSDNLGVISVLPQRALCAKMP